MKKTPFALVDGTVHQIIVDSDDYPENPRDGDNLGTMVCWHRNYQLGDVQPDESPEEYRQALGPKILELPLYLYDHSGITMSTGPFGCRWDSGQVGFIYVSAEAVKKEFGWSRFTPARLDQIFNILKGEVQTYDEYLRGNIYAFTHRTAELPEDWAYLSLIETAQANALLKKYAPMMRLEFEEDSCGGFYGDNPLENGMTDYFLEPLRELLKEAV